MASDKPTYPSDAAEKFIVRFPPGVREQIAEAAKAKNRSMNAEIVSRLERQDWEDADLQRFRAEAIEAQIEQARVGLRFITMALQFLEKECPEILAAKSLSLLRQSIGATSAALPDVHPGNGGEMLAYITTSHARCMKLLADFDALEPRNDGKEDVSYLAKNAQAALEEMAKLMEKRAARVTKSAAKSRR
jgi:hypothetical protein